MSKYKFKNAQGKVVELLTGRELISKMDEIAKTEATMKKTELAKMSMAAVQSSAPFMAYLQQNDMDLDDALVAYGFPDIGSTQVKALYDNDELKPLFNAVVDQYMREAFEKEVVGLELVARSVPMDQLVGSYTVALEKDEDIGFKKVGQAAPIPVTTIGLDGEKVIRVYKRGAGIEITYEAKSMNFSILQMHIARRAKKFAQDEARHVISRLLNGYYADGSDDAPVIGVETAGELTAVDIWFAAYKMQTEYGFTPNRAVMSLKMARQWLTLKDNGHLLFLNDILGGSMPDVLKMKPLVSDDMPEDKIMLVDTGFAIVEHVFKPLSTESEKNVETQVDGSYSTKTSDYIPFEKNARVIVDLDVVEAL